MTRPFCAWLLPSKCVSSGPEHCILSQYVRYNTVYLRALKSCRDDQLTLAHGTGTKNKEKTKNKNRVAQKKLSGYSGFSVLPRAATHLVVNRKPPLYPPSSFNAFNEWMHAFYFRLKVHIKQNKRQTGVRCPYDSIVF